MVSVELWMFIFFRVVIAIPPPWPTGTFVHDAFPSPECCDHALFVSSRWPATKEVA